MIKVVKSYYNQEVGVSVVTIATKIGNFTGTACFNDNDDPEYASRFLGCQIAECRARKSYWNEIRKNKKAEVKTLTNLLKNLCKETPPATINQIKKRIAAINSDIKSCSAAIELFDKSIETAINTHFENKKKIIDYIKNKEKVKIN